MLVKDINDNTPYFPPGGYSVKISEGAKANSDVIAAVAQDPDAGTNSQLVYELISGNTEGKFGDFTPPEDLRAKLNYSRQITFELFLSLAKRFMLLFSLNEAARFK